MKTLVIEMQAVKRNLQAIKDQADGSAIYADLSCNARGLGLLETARLLRDEGVRNFIVGEPKEAQILRDNGFTQERIMLLRSTADPTELETLMDLNVICTVGSYEAAIALNGLAEARSTVVEVQIEIDTGLGCYGFMPSETDKILSVYKYMPNLAVIGIFMNFSASWKSKKKAQSELDVFEHVLDKINEAGFETGLNHALDSAALFKYGFGRMDAVRVQSALAGRLPGGVKAPLYPVGYIEAGVEDVGWYPKGHTVGPEGKKMKTSTRIAVLSVGYYHGFGLPAQPEGFFASLWRRRRHLTVKLNGARAPVIGQVGKTYTLVDVTKINCAVGDVAVLDVDPINVKGLERSYR